MATSEQLRLNFTDPLARNEVQTRTSVQGWMLKSLQEVAPINMGQSPPGESYNDIGQGIPLLNGPTEFGTRHPIPVQWTTAPTKFCQPGDILLCVRGATTGRMNWADREYCIGRGLAALTPNPRLCVPEYVFYFVRTQTQAMLALASGSTFPNLAGAKLKALPIPLPPLAEQRRIVARIEELAARMERARGLRREAMREVQAGRVRAMEELFPTEVDDSWPKLSLVVERIENGWSPQCLPERAMPGEWGVLKVGAVSTGRFVPEENKKLPDELAPRPALEVRHGDFLFGRANTAALTGSCAVAIDPPPRLMLCDKIFRFQFREGAPIDKCYLDYALKSKPLREQIEAGATGTSSSMKNISKEKVLRLRLPLPPLVEQQQAVAYLGHIQTRANTVIRLQDESAAELDALLPAVLERAFKGEM